MIKYKIISMSKKSKTIKALRGECWHEIINEGSYGGATCKYCGTYSIGHLSGIVGGWYCPDGPDHQCYYDSFIDEKGRRFLTTLNGEKVIIYRATVKKDWENEDCCLFCGEPEERK